MKPFVVIASAGIVLNVVAFLVGIADGTLDLMAICNIVGFLACGVWLMGEL